MGDHYMLKPEFDVDTLLALHRDIFGDARMDATDVDDETDVDTSGDEGDEGDDAVADEADKDKLGDAGKQALDRMKAQRNAERQKRRDLEAALADATKPKPDTEKPDLDALRNEARTEAQATVLRDRALDKIEAKAAGRFKDPEDAVLRLGRNLDDFIDAGKIDVDAIVEALDELLEKRPDFAAVAQRDTRRFQGDADAGDRGGKAGKPQLSEDDVKRLSREGKHAEIEQARLDGRLNKLLGIS